MGSMRRGWCAVGALAAMTAALTGIASVGWTPTSQAAPANPTSSAAAIATAVSSPGISAPPNMVVGEADGSVDLPVTLSAPGKTTVTVAYATSTGGNCNNLNQAASGTLTFTPGVTTKAVRVILNNCGLATGGTFSFNLSEATHATIARASTTVTIKATQAALGAPANVTSVAAKDSATGSFTAPESGRWEPIK
jgi:hypothetical protein